MIAVWIFGCSEPEPTAADVRVTQTPLARCEGPVGFSDWAPGGHWETQYPENNARFLYTGGGLAVADFDGDGLLDVFLPGATRAQLFFGTSTGFEDRSDWLPSLLEFGVGASVVDIDADGDLDLYATRLGRPNALLRNDGDRFVDIAPELGIADGRKSITSSWADLDQDGDLDLFVANFGNQGDPRADANGLYIREADGFSDRSDWMPPDFSEAFTFTGGFFDLDGDGAVELYGVNDFGWKFPNQLLWWRDGAFVSDGNAAGLDVLMEGMGVGVGDLNDDGRMDLLMGSWEDVFLMQSSDAAWVDVADALGVVNKTEQDRVIAWGTEFADLDNDGDLDALVANGHLRVSENWPLPAPREQPDSLFVREGEGFVESSTAWGLVGTEVSRGFVLADFDRDGALDLLRRDLNGPARLHKGGCAGRALEVSLGQPGPNPNAIGAVIEVVGERTQRRWMLAGGTNFGAVGPPEVHFGVGSAVAVDLRVRWPDGTVHQLAAVPTHQRIHIERSAL